VNTLLGFSASEYGYMSIGSKPVNTNFRSSGSILTLSSSFMETIRVAYAYRTWWSLPRLSDLREESGPFDFATTENFLFVPITTLPLIEFLFIDAPNYDGLPFDIS
jgi:hypothetical protein